MDQKPMSVAVERRSQDITVARISGKIGLEALIGVDGKPTGISGNNALDESLRKAIPTPVKIVIVDLSDATFLSSIGISALVRLRQRCDKQGWVMRVVNPQPAVRRVLVDFTGLGDYLNVG